jgi:competence protein ComEC
MILIIISFALGIVFIKYKISIIFATLIFIIHKYKIYNLCFFIFGAILPHFYIEPQYQNDKIYGIIILNTNDSIIIKSDNNRYYKIPIKTEFKLLNTICIYGAYKNNQFYKAKIFECKRQLNIKLNILDKVRIYLSNIIKNSRYSNLIHSIILGCNFTNKELKDNFILTGTYHIFSISGFHISLLAYIIYKIIKHILSLNLYLNNRFNTILISKILTIIFLIIYENIIFYPISAIRALLMFIGKSIFNLYENISIAAFIILLYNPYYIFDFGFLLSFLCTLVLQYSEYFLPIISGVIINQFSIIFIFFNYFILKIFKILLYLIFIQLIFFSIFKIKFLFYIIDFLFDIMLFFIKIPTNTYIIYIPYTIKLILFMQLIFLIYYNDYKNIIISYIIISIISVYLIL